MPNTPAVDFYRQRDELTILSHRYSTPNSGYIPKPLPKPKW